MSTKKEIKKTEEQINEQEFELAKKKDYLESLDEKKLKDKIIAEYKELTQEKIILS